MSQPIGRVVLVRILFLILCLGSANSRAGMVEGYPEYAPVVDQAGALSVAQRARLTQRLVQFKTRVGSEVAILIMPSLKGQDLFAFSNALANQWKPGRSGIGDGIVVVLVTDDRQARIEVAKALEGAIPDAVAKRILAEQMSPFFAKGAYFDGLDAGLTALSARIEAEGLPPPTRREPPETSPVPGAIIVCSLFELVPIALFLAGQVGFQMLGRWSRFIAPFYAILITALQALVCAAFILFLSNLLPTIAVVVIVVLLVLLPIILGRYFWRIATQQTIPNLLLLGLLLNTLDGKVSFGTRSAASSSGRSSSGKSSSGGGDFGGGGASDRW
jgi:uncharacterized protein